MAVRRQRRARHMGVFPVAVAVLAALAGASAAAVPPSPVLDFFGSNATAHDISEFINNHYIRIYVPDGDSGRKKPERLLLPLLVAAKIKILSVVVAALAVVAAIAVKGLWAGLTALALAKGIAADKARDREQGELRRERPFVVYYPRRKWKPPRFADYGEPWYPDDDSYASHDDWYASYDDYPTTRERRGQRRNR